MPESSLFVCQVVSMWRVQVARRRELRLVQNQHLLRDPTITLFAEPLDPPAEQSTGGC